MHEGNRIDQPRTLIDKLKMERAELSAKVDHLEAFLKDYSSTTIIGIDRALLEAQHGAMKVYQHLLSLRINSLLNKSPVASDDTEHKTTAVHVDDDGKNWQDVGGADPVRDGPIPFDD